MIQEKDALVVVDVQNDFCPGGALGVDGADSIVPVVNALVEQALLGGAIVVFSRDMHPAGHCSFKEQGGPWPIHCVRDSWGAQFREGLVVPEDALFVEKATTLEKDAYSAFDGTGLLGTLWKFGVERVIVCGLATDYCVLETVKDALANGFEVVVVSDASRGISEESAESALREMRERGVLVISSGDILGQES